MPEAEREIPHSYEQPPVGDDGVAEALAAGQPAMRCDRPDLFGTREAKMPVEVAGWATSPAGIESVFVTVDGHTRVRAALGLALPEMAAILGEERAGDCGFFVQLDPDDCPPGWHGLTVVAVTGDGRALGVSGTVNCLGPVEAKVSPGEMYEPMPGPPLGPAGVISPPPEHYARYGWAARLSAAAKALDAGCGAGAGTTVLAKHASEVVGVDISQPAIADAKRDHAKNKKARFEQGDIRELPFADGEFDVVVCFETISQIDEPEPALDELRRVLAPGGLLLVSSPNRGVYPPGNPLHLNEMTSEELKRSLDRRFANVAIHRQQAYHASLLCSESTQAHEDPRVSIGAEVKKLAGGPPGSELYSVAVATDGQLPGEPAWVVLGENVDYVEQRRQLEMWQKRAVEAEVKVAEIYRNLHAMRRMEQAAVHDGGQHM